MSCYQKVVSGLNSWNIIFSAVVYTGPDIIIMTETILEFGKGNPPCNVEDNLRVGLLVIEARFRGY